MGYAEGIAWDDRQAARRESERLGWRLEAFPSAEQRVTGERTLDFVLLGRDGAPVEGARLDVTLYHHGRPNQPVEASLSGAPLRVTLPRPREGLWRVLATATRGDERFVVEADFWMPQAEGPAR